MTLACAATSLVGVDDQKSFDTGDNAVACFFGSNEMIDAPPASITALASNTAIVLGKEVMIDKTDTDQNFAITANFEVGKSHFDNASIYDRTNAIVTRTLRQWEGPRSLTEAEIVFSRDIEIIADKSTRDVITAIAQSGGVPLRLDIVG